MHALIIILMLTMPVMAEESIDPRQVLKEARELARNGDYEAALQKNIWFHQNALKYEKGLYGVRLSFALSDWVRLGESYPRAIEELKKIRDQDTARLRGGELDFALFHDVEAINSHLDEDAETVKLFGFLDENQPDFASLIFQIADDVLLRTRSYELYKKYAKDPRMKLDEIIQHREVNLENIQKNSSLDTPRFRQFIDDTFVRDVVELIEAAQAIGKPEAARAIQEKALTIVDSQKLRDAFHKPDSKPEL